MTSRRSTGVFDDYNGLCDLGARLAIDQYLAPFGLRPRPLVGCSAILRASELAPENATRRT
jgi:hypothetical protein